MSAWASGSLAEKLKQQKLAAANGIGTALLPAVPTGSATVSASGQKKNKNAPPPTPPAVQEVVVPNENRKPIASSDCEKPQLHEAAEPVHLGPISFPHELAKLVSSEFNFVGVVTKAPMALGETREPLTPNVPEKKYPPRAFGSRNAYHETPQMGNTGHAHPLQQNHHYYYHHHHEQHQHQDQAQNQYYFYKYQTPQQQQRSMQQGMTRQAYHSAYSSLPYNMSPHAMPYHPRMYNRYPGMNMGMVIYGGMQGYGRFSLQGRPAYYPPPQKHMGPYMPPHQQ
ncbi:hypothetical protein C3747_102g43 [Trypanosoma cruzi]|uniref:Uncharacterized protein n=2 Tax=Trypanosoma cruzi TaxID=5693 RepID=Q4D5G6_TRYCC|nr:hypothetical protein, conserved [Trypanosoma cruzi]EAN87775.1 hypothetical protein, conserved [Trypanosoma cruzi]PWV07372.1 hypothetical protein C3747_102g43 [Trypanosoma cruzi]RNC42885.1 hypothetical protein TcCL_NonESM07444 [Trypanosoma cruzi]|eukprot:XP_809626.1 hypothetical protein [Trypanosoma cruzi strain CL Brener]